VISSSRRWQTGPSDRRIHLPRPYPAAGVRPSPLCTLRLRFYPVPMTDARTIEADPAWLPRRIDAGHRRVEFLRIPRAQLSSAQFLADRTPASLADQAALSFDDVLAMRPRTGPLHFIFHTAFCRSTLLARALDIPGVCVGLSEPGIIGSLVQAGEAGARLMRPLLDLLSRPHAPGEMVFVKPTNHANRLIPALLAARPDAKAVLMTNGLPPFLAAIVRRGMLGRRWGRQLFLELQSYAGMDFGMDARESFAMTDLQAAALAWFLNQRWFAMQLAQHPAGHAAPRLRTLDGDHFAAHPAQTLRAMLALAGTDLPQPRAEAAATSPLFTTHAKLGGDFAGQQAQAAARTASPVVEEEIAQIAKWVGLIAQQAGLEVPVTMRDALTGKP